MFISFGVKGPLDQAFGNFCFCCSCSVLVTALAAACSNPGSRHNVFDLMTLLHSPKPKLNHGLSLILPSWTVEENIRNCRRASAELTAIPFNSSREKSNVCQGPCQVTGSTLQLNLPVPVYQTYKVDRIVGDTRFHENQSWNQYVFHKILLKAWTDFSGYCFWCFSNLFLLRLEFCSWQFKIWCHMVTGDLLLQFPSPLETEAFLLYLFKAVFMVSV